jgi:hypothetical protein
MLQANAVGAVGLFFQQTRLTNVSTESHVRLFKKNGFLKISSLQFNLRPELAVFHCDRGLISKLDPCGDDRLFPVNPATRVDLDAIARDLIDIDFFPDIDGEWSGNIHPFSDELLNFVIRDRF